MAPRSLISAAFIVGAAVLTACGGGDGTTSTTAPPEFRTCHYPKPPPSPENHIRVSGASCAVAATLWAQGPSLSDEKPHHFPDPGAGLRPRIRGEWDCQAELRHHGAYGTCQGDGKTVKFVFF
jgi:hypothetical protein